MATRRLIRGCETVLIAISAAALFAQSLPQPRALDSVFSGISESTLVLFEDGELSRRGDEFIPIPELPEDADSNVEPCRLIDYDPLGVYEGDLLIPPCNEPSPCRSVTLFVGYDAWRGIPDGSWENNGIHVGTNFGARLGEFSERTGIAFQAGGSVGVYDWSGTDYRNDNQNQAEVQGFITYGLFRRAIEESRWSAALVQDWMVNSNFSVFAQNPTMAQVRYQFGYATSAANEFGVWGAVREQGDTRTISGFGPVTWRPVNQVNAYWHHKWSPGGADTWLWLGVPERTRLSGGGSLGDYLAGTYATYPLSDRAAVYSQITYMHPSAAAGPAGATEESWNFSIGLALYPMRNARTQTVFGQRWTPQLPVATNGTFLVDASQTY